MEQDGPRVQAMAGNRGAVTGPMAGAGRYTDGLDQAAPSQDTVTPEPAVGPVVASPAPPPDATQKVSEMQATDENPPPGGSVVSMLLQPVAGPTGAGTEVGVAEGGPVVVVGAAVVGGTVGGGFRCAVVRVVDRAACDAEHPQTTRAATAMVRAQVGRR